MDTHTYIHTRQQAQMAEHSRVQLAYIHKHIISVVQGRELRAMMATKTKEQNIRMKREASETHDISSIQGNLFSIVLFFFC